jgi:hypothetical protein
MLMAASAKSKQHETKSLSLRSDAWEGEGARFGALTIPSLPPVSTPRIYPTTPRFALALPGKRGQGNNRLPPDDEGPAASFTVSWMSNHSAPLDIPKPASVDDFVKNGKKKKVSGSSRRPAARLNLPSCNVADFLVFPIYAWVCQSFMSSIFRKKGRSSDKKLLARREVIFGACGCFVAGFIQAFSVFGFRLPSIDGSALRFCRFGGEMRRKDGAPGRLTCCPQELLR